MRKHLLIFNPVSFHNQSYLNAIIFDIKTTFNNLDIKDYHVHVSRYPRDAISVIRKYIQAAGTGTTVRVYAVGGDGILFDCLNGVIGLENAELACVPYGNSNDFVRSFGKGKEYIFRDIELQVSSPTISTDVIFCGRNYALNTCTIGMEAFAVHKAVELNTRFMNIWRKLSLKKRSFMYSLMFWLGGVISAFSSRVTHQYYSIKIDGEDFHGNYATINIANGPCYGGDKSAAIAAIPNDGLLDTQLFVTTNIFNIIKIGTEYLYGKYYKHPNYISYRRAKEITVHSDEPLVLQLDGEIFLDTSITVKIVPAAVKIVAAGNLTYQKFWSLPNDK